MIRSRFHQPAPWRPSDDDLIRATIATTPVKDLARQLGRTPQAVRSRANRLGISLRRDGMDMRDREPEHLPTPEEIEAECAKIREGWTPTTLVSRVVDDATRELLREAVVIPVVSEWEGW